MEILSLPQMVSVNALMIIWKPLQGKGGLPGKWKEELLLYLGFSRMVLALRFLWFLTIIMSAGVLILLRRLIPLIKIGNAVRCFLLLHGVWLEAYDQLQTVYLMKGIFFLRWLYPLCLCFFMYLLSCLGFHTHTHTFFYMCKQQEGKMQTMEMCFACFSLRHSNLTHVTKL